MRHRDTTIWPTITEVDMLFLGVTILFGFANEDSIMICHFPILGKFFDWY